MNDRATKSLQVLLLNELLRIGTIDEGLYKLATSKLRSDTAPSDTCHDNIVHSLPIAITA